MLTPTRKQALVSYVLFATRLLIAGIFVWHGFKKVANPEMATMFFSKVGLPGALGPVIGWVELIGGGLLAAGALSRLTSLVFAGIMVGALVTVQIPGGISAGLERDLLILAATLLITLVGPGALALGDSRREPAIA